MSRKRGIALYRNLQIQPAIEGRERRGREREERDSEQVKTLEGPRKKTDVPYEPPQQRKMVVNIAFSKGKAAENRKRKKENGKILCRKNGESPYWLISKNPLPAFKKKKKKNARPERLQGRMGARQKERFQIWFGEDRRLLQNKKGKNGKEGDATAGVLEGRKPCQEVVAAGGGENGVERFPERRPPTLGRKKKPCHKGAAYFFKRPSRGDGGTLRRRTAIGMARRQKGELQPRATEKREVFFAERGSTQRERRKNQGKGAK